MQLTHHAYILEGEPAQAAAVVSWLRIEQNIQEHSPAVVLRAYEKFGVDDARSLRDVAALKGEGGRRYFIVATSGMTSESQQALLKLFEEPGEGVAFILIVPHGILLPTLRSRCLVLPFGGDTEEKISTQAQVFLSSTFKERTDTLALLLKDKEGDTRTRMRIFLSALEKLLYEKLHGKEGKGARAGLEEIAILRPYLSDRSPSLKMIFEHLAAALPQLDSR